MDDGLQALLSEGESNVVEFKERPDKSLASEVCAFANATGGKVYVGVADDGSIVGTDTSNAARSRIQDTINQIEPVPPTSMEVAGNVIVVSVAEGMRKPYCAPKGFYMRFGPNSQKLERDDIIEFMQNEGHIHYDEQVRDDLPVEEWFAQDAYDRYVKAAGISPVLGRDNTLKNLGCAADVGGQLCFTNAGALFFRDNMRDVKMLHAGIVCGLYQGFDKAVIIDAQQLEGDIVSNIDNALVFLKKTLRTSYKIKTLRRENVLELPEDALREAVTNAVMHRNYFERGARVMVEIFEDRVEITNPGGAPKGITPENFGITSIARNSVVASMLKRIRYIEQMGTGIRRIRDAARDAGVPEPMFSSDDYFFKVTFKRLSVDDLGNRVTERGQAWPGDDEGPNHLLSAAARSQQLPSDGEGSNQAQAMPSDAKRCQAMPSDVERRERIISLAAEMRQITSSQVAESLGMSKVYAREILRSMAGDGILEKVGDNRYARYILKKRKF